MQNGSRGVHATRVSTRATIGEGRKKHTVIPVYHCRGTRRQELLSKGRFDPQGVELDRAGVLAELHLIGAQPMQEGYHVFPAGSGLELEEGGGDDLGVTIGLLDDLRQKVPHCGRTGHELRQFRVQRLDTLHLKMMYV
jgi:hypothetical protein